MGYNIKMDRMKIIFEDWRGLDLDNNSVQWRTLLLPVFNLRILSPQYWLVSFVYVHQFFVSLLGDACVFYADLFGVRTVKQNH
jgi:hypothetical protein